MVYTGAKEPFDSDESPVDRLSKSQNNALSFKPNIFLQNDPVTDTPNAQSAVEVFPSLFSVPKQIVAARRHSEPECPEPHEHKINLASTSYINASGNVFDMTTDWKLKITQTLAESMITDMQPKVSINSIMFSFDNGSEEDMLTANRARIQTKLLSISNSSYATAAIHVPQTPQSPSRVSG
jgi:hypothetical protein